MILPCIILAVTAEYTNRWVLLAYLLCAPIPYTMLSAIGVPWPTGYWVWWVAVWHVAGAIGVCWQEMRKGEERWWVQFGGAVSGAVLTVAVMNGGTEELRLYIVDYLVLTIACAAALGVGWWNAVYQWNIRNAPWPGLLVAAYFMPDVAANLIYRNVGEVADIVPTLSDWTQTAHAIVAVCASIAIVRGQSNPAEPASSR